MRSLFPFTKSGGNGNESPTVGADSWTAAGVATSVPDGYLRLAPHWPNALPEVPFVLAAVDAALAAQRAPTVA